MQSNPSRYPMEPKLKLDKDATRNPVDPTEFKSIVGSLRYLVHTRADISYAVGVVSRYMERPTVLHMNSIKRILRSVKGTLEFRLIYLKKFGNHLLSGFRDSDFAGNSKDRKSTTGMVFLFM